MHIDEAPVLVERQADIATVWLNRPAKLNAMNRQMTAALAGVMRSLSDDDEIRCVLLRGKGRGFCPGADIGDFAGARASASAARSFAGEFHRALDSIGECRHPVIAVVHGACVGGGLQLAALCDLRIAGDTARFGIPVSRIGLTVDYFELAPIHQLMGRAALLELLLEARIIRAQEGYEKGLVNRVVPDNLLDAEANATARRIADGAPLVNRWHKKFVTRLADPSPVSQEEMEESFLCFDTEDYVTGYTSFLNKTKPVWKGR